MKKSLIAIAVAGVFASAAHAEDQGVTLYGVVDAAFGKEQHALSVDPQFPGSVNPVSADKISEGKSATGIFNGGISDSRWGIKGSEDLGDGMKAFFTLEAGFNLPTGNSNNAAASLASNTGATTDSANSSLNGQLFNRQAFGGLSDAALGSISVGRQYAPIYDIAVGYDPVQNAQLFSPLGFSGTLGGGGGVSENTRVDNSLKYANKIGGVNFSLMRKFGGTAGNNAAQSGTTFNVGFEGGNFGVQFAWEAFNDALKGGTGATAANPVTVTVYDTKAYMLAAKYKLGNGTIKAGFESYTLHAPSVALTIVNYYGFNGITPSNFVSAPQTSNVYFIGGDYNVTDKFNLAAGYYDVKAKQSNDLAQLSGDARYYSVLADYHFSKATDAYAGLMHSAFRGWTGKTTYAGNFFSADNIYAVGLRHKF